MHSYRFLSDVIIWLFKIKQSCKYGIWYSYLLDAPLLLIEFHDNMYVKLVDMVLMMRYVDTIYAFIMF